MMKKFLFLALCVCAVVVSTRISFAQGVETRVLVTSPALQSARPWWQSILSYVGIRSNGQIRPPIGTVFQVVSSAYASSVAQTDASPCVTAAGTIVRSGVVATNFLPIGTILSIKDKKYIVEDRMNARYEGRYMDIWFPSTTEALEFGRKKLEITVVGYGKAGDSLETPSPSPTPDTPENKGFFGGIANSLDAVWQLMSTKAFSNKDAYDVDCSQQ